ncbi:AIR synthase related protein [Halanaerobium salsuginis]|uniref:Alpha-ribazole kinase n=1 Tax=Halanaerobium salsuginis TaxID=29563 RepID=A0A1I4K402_9FIRM|nr:AIR synthase related protein [Halanaerobium salsuginis]SFL73409.1 alpha-ribazole kinase [Halanaerobium salsuginis]
MLEQRDISLIKIDSVNSLVIACDSAAAIGEKPADKLKISNYVLGQQTVKVALMEVLAVGAEPIAVIDTLNVELNPAGRKIIAGIKAVLAELGLSKLINGSTEENMETIQTGIGITVIGQIKNVKLAEIKSTAGLLVVAVGLPKVGKEVLQSADQVIQLKQLLELKKLVYVKEILPVGSAGILAEAKKLARGNELELKLLPEVSKKIDLEKSAGPVTTVLLTLPADYFEQLLSKVNLPITKIAYLDKLAD